MFQIYHSNSLSDLKYLLCEYIRRNPLNDPFAQEQILVQSPGMAQWLKLELAAAGGIAASVEFPLPASFLWKSFSQFLDDVPERSAYNKEAMGWKLMCILPAKLEEESFAPLRSYLAEDEGDFRLYQLCQKIADIFDQYLVYRPDWIDDWEQGGNLAAGRHPWQPLLWRALKQYSENLNQPQWHRANMFSAFIDALRNPEVSQELPPRLFVFGISALPQNYLEALQALGQRMDVHLMVMNPCRYYWGDLVDAAQIARLNRKWFDKPGLVLEECAQGNPLLASMGKLGRDYVYQLQDTGAAEVDAFSDPKDDSLLHRVQLDILNLDNRSAFPQDPASSTHKSTIEEDDRSLQVHACHSPLREVEVLHDQLLAMLQADPELAPRDIIVMMPDVASYAPYIESVFSSVPAERYISFSISDRTNRQENPLLQSFENLLRIGTSRLTVSDVLALLEVPAIMRRLSLDEGGFQQIRQWVDAANIRWGLDGSQRSLWDLPVFEQNSWRFGLRRMLLGYALGEEVDRWQEITPYPEIEGLAAEPLGILADFIDLLEEYSYAFSGERLLEQWINQVHQLIEQCYATDEQDELSVELIRRSLQQLQEQLKDANFQQSISVQIFADYMIGAVNNQRSSQRFMVGAVNFCTLMPMRSIPFKVVCLLGMNDGSYPRSIPAVGFDLMTDYPRRGDRSRRDDDRYLFLEALLSAQEKLYISYIGRSIQDNSSRIPSVLVSELLDYVEQSFCLSADLHNAHGESAIALAKHLCLQHPLSPFSESYFQASNPRLFSYAREWLPAARQENEPQRPFVAGELQSEEIAELEFAELQKFLRHPCRYFFNQRLRVYYRNAEIEAQDEEPFALEGLDAYLLKQRYLQAALAESNLNQLDRAISSEGILPVGAVGQQMLAKIRHDCTELAAKIQPLQQGEPDRQEINIELEGVRLTGWLDGCYPDHLLRYRPAQVKGNDYLNSWLEHLALSVSPRCGNKTLFRGLSGLLSFAPVEPDRAKALLGDLVRLYQQGMQRPLVFDASLAQSYLKQRDKDLEKAGAELQKRYLGSPYAAGLGQDPYIHRAFPDLDVFSTSFLAQLDLIYTPLLDYVEESKGD